MSDRYQHMTGEPAWDQFRAQLPAVIKKASRPIFAHVAARSAGTYMRNAGLGPGASFTSDDIPSRSPMDRGPLRIVTGRLVRSVLGSRTAGRREYIRRVQVQGSGFMLTIGTRVPYASAHENGFSGSVTVPTHQRRQTHAWGQRIEPKMVTVRTHTARRSIRARPFLRPAVLDSVEFIRSTLETHITNLLRSL